MINEANRVLGHDEIASAIVAACARAGIAAVRELRLESGCIADVAWISDLGAVNIVEVKSEFRPYYLDQANRKYGAWCNYLSLAIPTYEPLLRSVLNNPYTWPSESQAVGILTVDMAAVKIVRSASVRALPASRRLTMEIFFKAKLAAGEMLPGLKLADAAKPPNKNGGAS